MELEHLIATEHLSVKHEQVDVGSRSEDVIESSKTDIVGPAIVLRDGDVDAIGK